jgi:hypothetical protein
LNKFIWSVFFATIFNITRSIFESFSVKTELNVWHELLNLGFVKITHGNVKKAEPKPCLF